MPQYIITPWRYHSELLQVRRELYQLGELAPPADDRRHAVNWVGAWKMRGHLPHAVESTAHLVEAVLHHDATKNSTYTIRATYSAAFCRFVTGFCDIEQDGAVKGSMYKMAEVLNMPASFVELRHEATHEELPSLLRLSRNAKLALDWLWQHYWAKLEGNVDETGKPVRNPQSVLEPPFWRDTHDAIKNTMMVFMTQRKQEIKKGDNDVSQTSASGAACLELVKTCRGRKENLEMLASILVEERMLIPAGRQLSSSMEGAFLICGNLLRRLTVHQKRFTKLLLERMCYFVTEFSNLALELDAFREAVASWILHIFTSDLWTQPRTKELVWQQRGMVVNECVMGPNCWSIPLAHKLVEDGDLEFKEHWLPLLGMIKKR